MQFGLNPTVQNANLQNLSSHNNPNGAVVMLTTIWVQTSAVLVHFSAIGVATYQGISATYVRIA